MGLTGRRRSAFQDWPDENGEGARPGAFQMRISITVKHFDQAANVRLIFAILNFTKSSPSTGGDEAIAISIPFA